MLQKYFKKCNSPGEFPGFWQKRLQNVTVRDVTVRGVTPILAIFGGFFMGDLGLKNGYASVRPFMYFDQNPMFDLFCTPTHTLHFDLNFTSTKNVVRPIRLHRLSRSTKVVTSRNRAVEIERVKVQKIIFRETIFISIFPNFLSRKFHQVILIDKTIHQPLY